MRVGSLFSGIGGIELGFERAGGFETVWFVENDPHAQAVLRKHWPNATIYDDVTTIDFASLPAVDILTGGFPCQDISNAGKRAGIEGSRSGLWSYCVEAIRYCRPRLAVFENVSALIDRGLDVVLADLASLGYDAEWYCVPAAAVGAPHRRDRIVILAYSNGERQFHGQPGEFSNSRRESLQYDARESSKDLADTERERCGGWRSLEQSKSKHGAETVRRGDDYSSEDVGDTDERNVSSHRQGRDNKGVRGQHGARCSTGQPGSVDSGWWAVEPNVGRVADGVPLRVDRIKRLGNAVVPQWAQAVAEAIKEVEGW